MIETCPTCGLELPKDYWQLPWDMQRPFHRWFCTRCKHCISEAEAAPGLPGWCRFHWNTRAANVKQDDFHPRSKKSQNRVRKQKLTETYKALEAETEQRLELEPERAQAQANPEAAMRAILDRAAKRDSFKN